MRALLQLCYLCLPVVVVATAWHPRVKVARRSNFAEEEARRECRVSPEHHSKLGAWLGAYNRTHAAPLSPDRERESLWQVTMDIDELLGSPPLSSTPDCSRRPPHNPGAPLDERALCRYHYRINYDPKRFPASFTEAECDCAEVASELTGGYRYVCEPLQYNVRVLRFDDDCSEHRETTQVLTLACLPVLQSTMMSVAGNVEVGQVEETTLEI